jgi:uncharacterized protein (TIGR03000 family)
MEKVMAELLVRAALCAALVVSVGSFRARGAADDDGPAVKTTPTKQGYDSKIHVYLPNKDARLYFAGILTKPTGTDRNFRSPALIPGKRYNCKVVAVWVENGDVVLYWTSIAFKVGEDVAIDFRR